MSPRVVVIGTGMAGILSVVKLRGAGFGDIAVYEKADGLGGTWRANTYPGIACDVPSHLYSYSFAPNPDWSHVFSPGPEILAYLEKVAKEHRFDDYVVYDTEVTELRFEGGRWKVSTAQGLIDEADVVIAATGVLHHPNFPDFCDIDDFRGALFHSSRWDHTVGLEQKRVGVIGTGSSAVQIVSAIVDHVEDLRLFQRTAQWVLPVDNPPVAEEDRLRYHDDPAVVRQLREDLGKMFEDNFANAVVDANAPQVDVLDKLCRANLEKVKNPELREKLRPDYRVACKRLIVSPNFYEAIQRPNVHVITDRIERFESGGIRTADGKLHELDVVVVASGFRVDRFLRPMNVIGRGGVDLDNVWTPRPYAYLSVSVPDFPNLFMLNGPNGPVGNFSLIDVAEMQLHYILQLLELIADHRYAEVSAAADATARHEVARTEAAKKTVWMTGCRSWYLDDRGIPAVWPWTFRQFRQEMSAPKLEHYELVGH